MNYSNFIVIKGQPNTGKTTLCNALKNVLPNCKTIETDWIQIQIIRKKKIKISKRYENIEYNCLGQILNELDEEDQNILFDEIKKEIDAALVSCDTVITEGYLWDIYFYQKKLEYYKNLYHYVNICFITCLSGYNINIILNEEKADINNSNIEITIKKIIEIIRTDVIKRFLPFFGNYQQFDFLLFPTSSQTIKKLNALNLPDDLTGKRILDVGCNNGFFTIECSKRGASESIGIDNAKQGILVANMIRTSVYFCKNVFFLERDANESLSDLGKFDYILILSIFHYLKNQYQLLQKFLSMLNTDGILKLEMGIYQSKENIINYMNNKFYPSEKKIYEWLNGYNFTIDPSINQAGDDVPRFVITIRNNK